SPIKRLDRLLWKFPDLRSFLYRLPSSGGLPSGRPPGLRSCPVFHLLFRLVSLFCTGRKRRGGRLSVLLPESLCLFFCSAPLPDSIDYLFSLFSCLLNRSAGGSLPLLHNLVFGISYRGSLLSSLCLLFAVSCPDIGSFHIRRR